jgi:hypothetical protein
MCACVVVISFTEYVLKKFRGADMIDSMFRYETGCPASSRTGQMISQTGQQQARTGQMISQTGQQQAEVTLEKLREQLKAMLQNMTKDEWNDLGRAQEPLVENRYYIDEQLKEAEREDQKEIDKRFVADVQMRRVNPDAQSTVDLTLEQLTAAQGTGRVYIPAEHKSRILRLYGGFTVRDFDKVFRLNEKMGSVYSNCWLTFMHYMVEGTLDEQVHRVDDDPALHEIFNIVQSVVRFWMSTRTYGCMHDEAGDSVWYDPSRVFTGV